MLNYQFSNRIILFYNIGIYTIELKQMPPRTLPATLLVRSFSAP